ncbi:MAG: LamG domain-containing protein, partial [Bacteroidota bacterium]
MRNFYFFLLLLSFSTSLNAQINLNRGLVAYYPFNGNANDASGNDLNGSLFNGPQLTTDKSGNPNSAYYFDGIDDYIEIADDPKLRIRDSFTVSLMYYVDPANALMGGTLIQKRERSAGRNSSFDVGVGASGAVAAVKTNNNCSDAANGWNYTSFSSPPSLGQWYCLVVTYKTGVLNFYIDGSLISSTVTAATKIDSCEGGNVRIARHLDFDPLYFKGKVDEVRLYNRAINVDEIYSLCVTPTSLTCNNWLNIKQHYDRVVIGDLDITGNKVTVEANFNPDRNYAMTDTASELVSKHTFPGDCNYLLRPLQASVTTSNGFFVTGACDYAIHKTYHAAFTYDGTSLKFYRNGYLMSQVPASGNLVTNDLLTTIGNGAGIPSYGIPGMTKGYLNEVRIWNVARTKEQLQTYMNTSLPDPTHQPGLKGYYTFDNLLNKQGNNAYNGVLVGISPSVNNTNPDCPLIVDSCEIITPVKLTSFITSTASNKNVQLQWNVEEEIYIKEYIIERSVNGYMEFIALGKITPGTNG